MIFQKYKTIKQIEERDCGPACISTLLLYFDIKVSISKLRELCGTNIHGTTALGLTKCLKQFGFEVTSIKTTQLDKIENCEFPIIAMLRDQLTDHYIVIFDFKNGNFVVGDPALGTINMSFNDLKQKSNGLFILLNKNQKQTIKITEQYNMKEYIIDLIKKEKSYFAAISFFSLLITILNIVGSMFYKQLVDNIIPRQSTNFLINVSIIFLSIYIFKSIVDYLRQSLSLNLSKKIDIKITSNLYDKLLNLPYMFFNTRKTGEITARITDAQNIRNLLANIFNSVFLDFVMLIACLIALITISPVMFMLTIIETILCIIILLIFRKKMLSYDRELMENNAQLQSTLIESINGYEKIKSFNYQNNIYSKLLLQLNNLENTSVSYGNLVNKQIVSQEFITNSFMIITLSTGSYFIMNGTISLGDLMFYSMLLSYFINPILSFVRLIPTIQSSYVSFERMRDILDLDSEFLVEKNHQIDIKKVELKNIVFRYNVGKVILNNISLNIHAGKKIGIVGKTGSGKTTLLRIMMGFLEKEEGEILIGEIPIEKISKKELRRKIGYVSQTPFFFASTIKENLLMGLPDNEDNWENLVNLCESLDIHSTIDKMPLKYNTILTENGTSLSGGQRQKLSLVQALLKKPSILILDEATSSLDPISEFQINEFLNSLKDITIIIVSHRLSSVKNCDYLYVMQNGAILESGTHSKLINNSGLYADLWTKQNYLKQKGA